MLNSARAADVDELLYQEALSAAWAGERGRALSMLETLVGRQPQHAGAWMDLALLFCDVGDTVRSRAILKRIEDEFDPPRAIRDLVHMQMNRECGVTKTSSTRWSASVQAGHDSNANRGASTNRVVLESGAGPVVAQLADSALPKPDYFVESLLEGAWQGDARSLRVSALSREYSNVKTQSAQTLAVAAEQLWNAKLVDGLMRFQSARMWLGGKALLDSATLTSGLVGQGAWQSVRPALDVALTFNRFPTASVYDARVWTVRPGLIGTGDNYFWRTNLLAMADTVEGARPGGSRYGLGGELLGTWKLSPSIRLSGNASVQVNRSQTAYFPPLLNTKRRQVYWLGQMELAVEVTKGLNWVSSITGQRSADNLPFLDYRSRTFQSGLALTY